MNRIAALARLAPKARKLSANARPVLSTLSRQFTNSSGFAHPASFALTTPRTHGHAPVVRVFARCFSSAGEVVNVPSMGDSISEGTVVQWTKAIGDYVEQDDVVVVLETDKVSVDVRAPKSGVVTGQLAKEDETVLVGAPLFSLDSTASKPAGGESSEASKEAPKETPKSESAKAEASKAEASKAETPKPAPAAPKSASKAPPAPKKQAEAPKSAPAVDSAAGTRSENRVKMNRMRLRIAERLKQAQNTYAMLTTFQETDMSSLIETRNLYKDEFEKKHGVKLGFMSAFIKASAMALREVPGVNGVIDDENKEIVYRDYCDISVAVATPKGLVVPVVRNCESLSFAQIEKTIAELGQKARDGTIEMEDMAGGTFTISNGGVFGSLMGTPIVNPPQSAILGMHATKMRPVVTKKGDIVARPMMYLALTYDHRLIDGREAVTFLKSVAQKIEDPRRLLLDL